MISLLFLAVYCIPAYAQGIISGTVSSTKGESLPGVNVIVEGTTTGTVTNMDGKFQIQASPNAKLIFTFIGFETQRIAINGKTTINVSLQEDAIGLEEIVAWAMVCKRKAT